MTSHTVYVRLIVEEELYSIKDDKDGFEVLWKLK